MAFRHYGHSSEQMSIVADFLPGRGCAQANFSQFLRRENAQMAAFLRRCLEVANRGRTIEQIRDGKAKPSQQLADAVERMLKGNTEFELIDEQKVVDEKALALAPPTGGTPLRAAGAGQG